MNLILTSNTPATHNLSHSPDVKYLYIVAEVPGEFQILLSGCLLESLRGISQTIHVYKKKNSLMLNWNLHKDGGGGAL